jgi:hypothetical protein
MKPLLLLAIPITFLAITLPAAAQVDSTATTTTVLTDTVAQPVVVADTAGPAMTTAPSANPLAVGQSVRLVMDGEPYAGRITRITADTVVLGAKFRIYTLQRARITQAERLTNASGRGHAVLRGAGFGALAGGALGGLASLALTKDPAGRGFITADGLVLGALIGAFVGPRSYHPVWERVDPAAPDAAPSP